jgi:dynein heavy chain
LLHVRLLQKATDLLWLQVLEGAKSSYLPPFLNLRNLLQRDAVVAEDNVKFLVVLEEPCQVLSKAMPGNIPAALPKILNAIRLVWNLSRFYNTPERITGLLRKVLCAPDSSQASCQTFTNPA